MTNPLKQIIKAVLPQPVITRIKQRRRKNQQKATFQNALRPSDVFFIGHPKSGNTWLAYMLGIVLQKDRSEKVTTANVGEFVPVIHVQDWKIARFAHLPDPRVFRNEAPVYPELYPKTIYIIRDARAALLSYYHHCSHDLEKLEGESFSWSIDEFLDEMLTVGCIKRLEPDLLRWDRQIAQWQERAKRQAVKFVKYEDLLANTKEEFRGVLEFAGIPCDEDLLNLAVQRGTFKSMRKQEEIHGAESFPGEKGKSGFFVRKGKTDSWREEMTPAQIARIEKAFWPTLKALGYL